MEIPFVTLKKYDGLVLQDATGGTASIGGDQGVRWFPTDDAPSWAAGATEEIFKQRGDRLRQVYKLDYGDINGLGNSIYRLDGDSLSFCLKVLGASDGNERETRVWTSLGYGRDQAQQIKGLPPIKFTFLDRQLRTVLTPYYPGVLKAVSGGSYEFPLVICAALYVEETLSRLHEHGLAYMDLCPSNILFKTTPEGAMLFFLTDMGGVKPLVGGGERHTDLLEVVVPRRWTRREVLPPANLFAPHEQDARLEANPGYDYYTLGRTCQVLLGLGPEDEESQTLSRHLGEHLCLEDPMRPTREEMSCFLELIGPWLSGNAPKPGERARIRGELAALFRRFFETRHHFTQDYLGAGGPGDRWRQVLRARLVRYRMALCAAEYQALSQLLAETPQQNSEFRGESAQLEAMVAAILARQYEPSLSRLEALGQSRLVRVSRVANYALFHHKKILRGMFGGKPELRELMNKIGRELPQYQAMAEEPESATSKAVRRENGLDLGILRRVV